jgi:hypothetical protein
VVPWSVGGVRPLRGPDAAHVPGREQDG